MLIEIRKPKLPRKRKKAMIKAQGRKSYFDTIKLAKATEEYPCKFWDNSSISLKLFHGILVSIPTRYW